VTFISLKGDIHTHTHTHTGYAAYGGPIGRRMLKYSHLLHKMQIFQISSKGGSVRFYQTVQLLPMQIPLALRGARCAGVGCALNTRPSVHVPGPYKSIKLNRAHISGHGVRQISCFVSRYCVVSPQGRVQRLLPRLHSGLAMFASRIH
jgi:hypothetical protein